MSGTRAKGIALAAVLQLIAVAGVAQTRGIDSLFPAEPVGHVNDFASVIDPGSSAAMEDLLARLRNATGAEVAVVTLPSSATIPPTMSVSPSFGGGASAPGPRWAIRAATPALPCCWFRSRPTLPTPARSTSPSARDSRASSPTPKPGEVQRPHAAGAAAGAVRARARDWGQVPRRHHRAGATGSPIPRLPARAPPVRWRGRARI